MDRQTIAFLGGGRVVRFLLRQLVADSHLNASYQVYEPDTAVAEKLAGTYPGVKFVRTPQELAERSSLIFIAVHPPAILKGLEEISPHLSEGAQLVSLGPKITLARMSQQLPAEVRLVRFLPNAASLVGAGFNPYAFGQGWAEEERQQWHSFCRRWGEAYAVPEAQLETYAVLTAMGPTYFWFQWEELSRMAVELGLHEQQAHQALKGMLVGALKLYFESGLSPAEVQDLIPVRPLAISETPIRAMFNEGIQGILDKIRP